MKDNLSILNNIPSKVGLVTGTAFGIWTGMKEKKAIQYALIFGTFGAIMGLIAHNTFKYEIKKGNV